MGIFPGRVNIKLQPLWTEWGRCSCCRKSSYWSKL